MPKPKFKPIPVTENKVKNTFYCEKCNIHCDNVKLFEIHNKNGMMEGYTDNYIKITTPFKKEWENNIVPWKI